MCVLAILKYLPLSPHRPPLHSPLPSKLPHIFCTRTCKQMYASDLYFCLLRRFPFCSKALFIFIWIGFQEGKSAHDLAGNYGGDKVGCIQLFDGAIAASADGASAVVVAALVARLPSRPFAPLSLAAVAAQMRPVERARLSSAISAFALSARAAFAALAHGPRVRMFVVALSLCVSCIKIYAFISVLSWIISTCSRLWAALRIRPSLEPVGLPCRHCASSPTHTASPPSADTSWPFWFALLPKLEAFSAPYFKPSSDGYYNLGKNKMRWKWRDADLIEI